MQRDTDPARYKFGHDKEFETHTCFGVIEFRVAGGGRGSGRGGGSRRRRVHHWQTWRSASGKAALRSWRLAS